MCIRVYTLPVRPGVYVQGVYAIARHTPFSVHKTDCLPRRVTEPLTDTYTLPQPHPFPITPLHPRPNAVYCGNHGKRPSSAPVAIGPVLTAFSRGNRRRP